MKSKANTIDIMKMPRFLAAGPKSLHPSQRKEGYRYEVIDRTHPSDGGPVSVFLTKIESEEIDEAKRLNRLNGSLT